MKVKTQVIASVRDIPAEPGFYILSEADKPIGNLQKAGEIPSNGVYFLTPEYFRQVAPWWYFWVPCEGHWRKRIRRRKKWLKARELRLLREDRRFEGCKVPS